MKPLDPRLLKFGADTRRYVRILAGSGMLETALIIAQCILIAWAISPVIDGDQPWQHGALFGILTLAVFLVRSLLIYYRESLGHRAALRTIARLRAAVVKRAGDLGERWLGGGNTTSTVSLVTSGLDDLETYFVKFLPQLILSVTATPLCLIVILCMDWVSAVAIIVCIPLVPLFMVLIGRLTESFSAERLASMQRLGQQLLDLLGGLATLKALGREKGPARRVRQLGDDYASKTMQTLYVAFLSGGVLEFLTTLSTAIVAVEVGLRMVSGHMGLFVGLAIIMLTPEVFNPIREVGTQFHASANGVAASNAAFAVLEQDDLVADGTMDAPDLASATIRIEDLTVRAPGRDTIAPAHLTATIAPGQITALRGPSGAGKSTTAAVLERFVDPTSGAVIVGGLPLGSIARSSLWAQMAWIPQRPAIVPGTVADNVVEGGIVTQAAEDAASLTGFTEVLDALPERWNVRVGQGGVGLSVGQRQRLALTRALLSDRRFVILDEPSAHLDAASEAHVVRAVEQLRAQGRTVLVIAHRAALIAIADNVVDVTAAPVAQPAETEV